MKKIFEMMSPSEKQKSELFDAIFYSPKKQKKMYVRKKYMALIAASIVISTVTAFACISTRIQEYSTQIQKWSVSEFAENLDISDTDKNITITAESVFGDNENFYILFSVCDEKGNPLPIKYDDDYGYIKLGDINIDFDKNNDYSGSTGVYYVNDTENGNTYFVLHTETLRDDDVQNIGQSASVTIRGLYTGKFTDIFEWSPENKGVWEFEIPLDYVEYGQTYQLHESLLFQGKTVYLETFHYSPLDIQIHMSSEEGYLEDFVECLFDGRAYVVIETTKGTIYPTSSTGKNDGTSVDIPYNMVRTGIFDKEDIISIHYYEIEPSTGKPLYEQYIPLDMTE